MNSRADNGRMAAWLDQVWLARYLDGELTEVEATWFEAYVLDKPDLLAQIDADTRLREAYRVATPSGLPGSASDAREPPPRRRPHWMRPLALAAGIAALFVGFGVGRIAQRSPSVIGSPPHIVYETLRGEPAPPVVQHRDASGDFVYVEFAVPEGASALSLRVGDDAAIALQLSSDNFASALVRRDRVQRHEQARLSYMLDGKERSQTFQLTLQEK